MSDPYLTLRSLICEYCGVHFDEETRPGLSKRLASHLRQQGFEDCQNYCLYLRDHWEDPAAWQPLLDETLTCETYFFRETAQMLTFRDKILREIRLRMNNRRLPWGKGEAIRIWSAGCATGEEPYTLAMMLLESGILFEIPVIIYASDINSRLINSAKKGSYQDKAFRVMDPSYRERYFTKHEDGYHISGEVKKLVEWVELNLYRRPWPDFLTGLDAIFCRNVMIYLHKDARKFLAAMFYDNLNNGGYLFLGHAESLVQMDTPFALKYIDNEMVYQKE